jgi:peptidoglycan/LPS O-acetylase OafA/YrhL
VTGFAVRDRLGRLFEIDSRDRLLPMEGLRGVAVFLVFCQHFGMQFVGDGHLTGATLQIAEAMRRIGNYGVELFFVLSGFLIYGILLRKNPNFADFMLRRAQRLYPAFLAAFLLACLIDASRPQPFIPHAPLAGANYLAANLAFLPGLFPITPISAVNWSLSYEWWFYAVCTMLFATFGLSRLQAGARVFCIAALAILLTGLSAAGLPNVPVRGLSLLFGMLLAEAARAKVPAARPGFALTAVATAFVAAMTGWVAGWLLAVWLASAFALLCSAAFFRPGPLGNLLSLSPIRWLGNISYSFYLIHGMVVVTILRLLLPRLPASAENIAFWSLLLPLFAAAFVLSACLFLAVEKPLSLQRKPRPIRLEDQPAIAGWSNTGGA